MLCPSQLVHEPTVVRPQAPCPELKKLLPTYFKCQLERSHANVAAFESANQQLNSTGRRRYVYSEVSDASDDPAKEVYGGVNASF